MTLHNEQILLADNGTVKAVPLEKSGYSPIMIWNGELAGKIVSMNLYNPNRFIEATCAAIFEWVFSQYQQHHGKYFDGVDEEKTKQKRR